MFNKNLIAVNEKTLTEKSYDDTPLITDTIPANDQKMMINTGKSDKLLPLSMKAKPIETQNPTPVRDTTRP